MIPQRSRPGESGFTLIEVLIALVILTVGMAGMIPVMVQTVRGNTVGRDRTSSATWAQDKLEELRRADWDTTLTGFLGTTTTETDAATGLTRGWRILDTCTACTTDRIWAIEVCAAETVHETYSYTDVCFSATPLPAFHFFSLRSNL